MRKLASIRMVNAIEAIQGADRIELIRLDGWKTIAKKGEFNVGDLCVYFEIDSFLPEREEFEFLRKNCFREMADGRRGFRLRTMKLRGEYSQGLAMPMNGLGLDSNLEIGTDLTELLGVEKWEPPIPPQLDGEVVGNDFPAFMQKTDEERIQNFEDNWDRLRELEYFVTEKLDGTSCIMFYNKGEFGVCGRNWQLARNTKNSLWKAAIDLDVESKMTNIGRNLAIQGELIGEGIQKNIYKINGQKWYVFNVFDIDEHRYLPKAEAVEICKELDLEMVPVISESMKLPSTVDEVLAFAEGKSILNANTRREGLVWVGYDENLRVSFKTISNAFLMKHE